MTCSICSDTAIIGVQVSAWYEGPGVRNYEFPSGIAAHFCKKHGEEMDLGIGQLVRDMEDAQNGVNDTTESTA